MRHVDVTVVGGGINGVSVAAEAASRGLSTILLHSRDIASSASATPVTLAGIHLRHLSALDYFQLNSMLDELQGLYERAPHLIDFLPVTDIAGTPVKETGENLIERYFQGLRDKTLKKASALKECARTQSVAARLKPSRLIVSKALQAQNHGATIMPYHTLVSAEREHGGWQLAIKPERLDQQEIAYSTKIIINCTGYWANDLLEKVLKVNSRCRANEEHRTQFFFKNPAPNQIAIDCALKITGENNRSYYVHPATEDLLAFGPRKCDQNGYDDCIDLKEDFIQAWNHCAAINKLDAKISKEQFLHQNKYRLAIMTDPGSSNNSPMTAPLLDLDNPGKEGVLLNIFGVDAVLHRKVARQALDVLEPFTKKGKVKEFKNEKLPGGDIAAANIDTFIQTLAAEFNFLPLVLITRLAQTYGNLTYAILGQCDCAQSLGQHFGHHLYECEVRYLLKLEWATSAEDILWRRTLLGVLFNQQQTAALQAWIDCNNPQ